jgi:hypothetical protein
MEDRATGARGLEDHGSTVLQLSGGGGGAVVVTPEPGGGLLATDGEEVCGALEVRLFAPAEGADFAVGLVNPLEAVSSSLDGRMSEAGEAKGSSLEERPMSMEEEKVGSLSFAEQDSAEPASLRMCHVANGELSDKDVHVLFREACRFKDVGCVNGTLDKVTGGSSCELDDLVGNSGGVAEIKTCMGYIDMASEETNHCNVGSSDSVKPSSKQCPHGVDGLGTITYANNEPQQDDLAPNIEAEVLNADSVSSVSGSTGVSVGEAVQFLQRSDNPVTSHVADASLWNKNCFCDPAGCMHDMVDMATKGNPCEQNSLAGESVFSAGVDTKTSLHNLEMHCKEPHDGNKGQPGLLKIGIEQLPYGMAVTCLKKNAAPNLEKYGFLPKAVAEDSVIMHEKSVPSVSGSSIAVSLDGMPAHIGDSSENRAMMEKVTFGSQGGGKLSLESQFCSREVNTSEEGMGTGWTEASHGTGDMSDLGEHHTEKLPSGTDGLPLITGANQEMERVLPNIDPVGSCPVDEGSVLSIYGSSIDVPLDGKDDLMGCVSERSSNVDKPTCSSLGGETLLCESGLQSKAYGYEKNQESSMEAFNRLNISLCKSSMEELKSCGPSSVNGIQQISKKYGIPESSPERDLHCSYKLQQQCNEEPCFSGRESSALCLGRQDPGVGGSGSLDLNACNSADDKAGSVDFVTNGNDTESQSQQLSTMLVFRRRNPKRAASSRNLHSEKSDQINKASSGSSRPKKVEPPKSLYQSITDTIPNKITRGRRDLNRPHKSSVWGNLEKLMGDFSQSYGHLTPNSHPTPVENGRSSKIFDQKNLSNIRKCRSSRSSRSRCSTSSDAGHLTNELNEQPAFSGIADSAYLESRREVIPKVASYTPEFTDSTDTHHLKRDFVSSTQEVCSAEIHGECAKPSTSGPPLKNDNDTVMLPVGFSPDSVLEIASITCESNASASHDVILHENPLAGVLNGGGHHSAVLPTSYLGRNQTPSLMQLEQQDKIAGVSENMKSEQTDPFHTMMNNDAGKGDLQNLQKSKTVRKNIIVRKKGSNKKEGTTGKKTKSRSSTQISSCEASKPRAFSNDAILPDSSELLVHTGYPELDSHFELQTSPLLDHGNATSHSVTEIGKESAFHTIKSPKHKRKDANVGKKGKVRNSHTKGKGKKKHIADGTSLDCGFFSLHSTSLATSHKKEQSTSVF